MATPAAAPETSALPDNAYTTLGPGETYQPVVPASSVMAETT